jgi:hypothetical protein
MPTMQRKLKRCERLSEHIFEELTGNTRGSRGGAP